MSWLDELARPEILALKPYEHARWDTQLQRLHANELPWRALADHSAAGLNRYPEPQPGRLIERLAALYQVPPECVLLGRGSDEVMDLLVRAFCRAYCDSVLVCPPTFGMYAVCAHIQGAGVVEVPLRAQQHFSLDIEAVLAHCTPEVKLLFLCSPNNPTGNLLDTEAVLQLSERLAGRALVVVDEAYIEFSGSPGLSRYLAKTPQLAVMRTLSKAYALAGARCGALLAAPELVLLLRKLIAPYAITQPTLEVVLDALTPAQLTVAAQRLQSIARERSRLQQALARVPGIRRAWRSDANFVLAECVDAQDTLRRAQAAGLLIRDVRSYPGLDGCVRVTVGDSDQNTRLLEALQ
ncbi:MAG: histidinol-phosphate transaminase [Sinobacteraceae bacterium]|nr:histidinol-phosphate transaminase [Nevskiaceae bacterium]